MRSFSRKLAWLAGLLALLTLTGCGTKVPPIAPLDGNAKVLVFGDDFVAGVDVAPEQSFAHLLGQQLSVPVVVAGKAGETSDEGMLRLKPLVDAEKPTLVVICHGWSDLFEGVNQDETIDAIRGMVGMLQHRKIDVVLMAIPMPRLDKGMIKPVWFYRKIAKVFKVPLHSATLPYAMMEKELHTPDWNLTPQGHQTVAKDLRELLNKAQGKEE